MLTRVKSLTIGLNKCIFTTDQTPYEKLFDENCILDISRVKSTETKALIMGLMVYILNEYRMDQKKENNNGLRHVTVLEEAHNLLKNTSGSESELIGKSVEMLTNTIAEIRTYGEGFIIVDQSPSSVDIAAIKNTNTKIILRTPEAHDREAVGRSIGLSDDQVNEIAKLPGGVAVVYQNNWISPVLTMIDKANVCESIYEYDKKSEIMPVRAARTYLIRMVMQPWIGGEKIQESVLKSAIKVLEISRHNKKKLNALIEDYTMFNGQLIWQEDDLIMVRDLIQSILEIKDKDFKKINSYNDLKKVVRSKLNKISKDAVQEICYLLTVGEEKKNEDD